MAKIWNVVGFLCLTSCSHWHSQAAEPDRSETTRAAQSLDSVLAQEALGKASDRRELLKDFDPRIDSKLAWQMGMIQRGEIWQSFELESNDSNQDKEYLEKRNALENDPEGPLKLARWCVDHQFRDRARAHYFCVLLSSPDHREARAFLGHTLVGGKWFDQNDLALAKFEVKQTLESFDEYLPKLRMLFRDLRWVDAKSKSKALKQLSELNDAKVIPALEIVAVNVDDDLARSLVNKIASFRSHQACLTLARIAICCPSHEIQSMAVDHLKSYPFEFFVPDMLDLLVEDVKFDSQLVCQRNGRLSLISLFQNELQSEKHTRRIQKHVDILSVFRSSSSVELTEKRLIDYYTYTPFTPDVYQTTRFGSRSKTQESHQATGIYIPIEIATASANSLVNQAERTRRDVQLQNKTSKASGQHAVYATLRAVTSQELGDHGQAWWQWWNDTNDRYGGSKSQSRSEDVSRHSIQVHSSASRSHGYEFNRKLGAVYTDERRSCLVRGTLVRTSNGLKAIETIHVGDLVLSQNVETGELAYQPVLATTVRPPKSTLKIVTHAATIQATPGHLWWIGGQGWTQTRELQVGMQLRNASATTEVLDIIPDQQEQETYNLVVDQFHTYFVGTNSVLSYDNTPVKPTLRSVPGYGVLAKNR